MSRSRNFQRLRAAPQPFQAVVFPRLWGKDVDQQVAVIGKHPLRLIVAFYADGQLAGLILELESDFVGDGLNLALIGARTDYKEVREGGDAGEIQDLNVGGLF